LIVSENKGASFEVSDQLFNRLTDDDRLVHIGRTADGAVFALSDNENESALLRGFDDDLNVLYQLENALVDGWLSSKANEVILGKSLLDNLNVSIDDSITLQSLSGKILEVKIVGTFDLGVSAVNESWIVAQADLTQNLFNLGSTYTGVD